MITIDKVWPPIPFAISESVTQADAGTDLSVLPIDSCVQVLHFKDKKSQVIYNKLQSGVPGAAESLQLRPLMVQ